MTAPNLEQLVSALVAHGTDRANAEKLARRKLGLVQPDAAPIAAEPTRIVFPVRLTLPWSALVSDNDKHTIGGGARPIIVNKTHYREAKYRIARLAKDVIAGAEQSIVPLALTARVFVPDNRPHDCGNFRKLVTDALEGVVYKNDKQLWREVWERAGVDVDVPRAEITITPIANA